MVINNEDYQTISISEGIFSTNEASIPDGFAAELENLIIHDGILEHRSGFTPVGFDFISVATQGWANTSPPIFPPTLVNLPIASSQTMLAAFVATYPTAARPALVGITTAGAIINKIVPAATFKGPVCVYNQTMYASATTGIIKVGISNYPTSITETLIASSPTQNGAGLLVHKSRLFTWEFFTNRIYFTDAPAVGGLPETWNTVTNFIDVNSSINGSTYIWSVVSLGNYLYIFTNSGLFSLYTSGAPSNWILKSVNQSISVGNQTSVVSKNSLIYYVTETGVYVTDGFEFKLLSQSLTSEFYGNQEFARVILQLFDGGLLLCVSNVSHTILRCYHTKFNKIAWTSMSVPTPGRDLVADYASSLPAWYVNPIYLVATEIPQTAGATIYDSFIIAQGSTGSVTTYVLKYRSSSFSLDSSVSYSGNAVASSTSAVPPVTIITRDIMDTNFMRTKKWQTLHLLITGNRTFTAVVKPYLNFQGLSSFDPTAIPITATPSDPLESPTYNAYLLKAGIFKHAFALKLKIKLTALFDGSLTNPSYSPLTVGTLGITSILESTQSRTGVRGQ